jgi:hypothetical protein
VARAPPPPPPSAGNRPAGFERTPGRSRPVLLFLPALAALILGILVSVWLVGSTAYTGAGIVFGGTVVLVLTYGIALAIIQSTLQSIFLTACYQYATTGEVPSAFSRQHIVEAWRPKKK